MSVAYIALGSNLGDRAATLKAALDALGVSPGINVVRHSSFHETDPIGGPPGQGRFLNAAAELLTDLLPAELLNRLLDVEKQFGRIRTVRDAPRTLDLDLLLYDDLICAEGSLTVPHPRMHEREFVLAPLAEIAADAIHPVLAQRIGDLIVGLATPLVAKRHAQPDLLGLRSVVTGSTRGIGRSIALAFAEAGADVIVHGRTPGKAVVDSITALGRRGACIHADLANLAALDRLVDEAWERLGGIDVWVNNAGADILTGESAHEPFSSKLEHLLDTDVRATIHLSRAIGERMLSRGGVIINMGWDQAETGMDGDSGQLFAAAKGAVMAFSKSLAVTLAPKVRVNCIAPGWIKTAWGASASTQWHDRVLRETPLGRWGAPADVAAAAVWIASPSASFITGQVIRVNGGAVR